MTSPNSLFSLFTFSLLSILFLSLPHSSIGQAVSIDASQVSALSEVYLSTDLKTFTLYFAQSLESFGSTLQISHFQLISDLHGSISLAGSTLTGPHAVLSGRRRQNYDANATPSTQPVFTPSVSYLLALPTALAPSSSGETFSLRFVPPGPPPVCTPALTLADTSSATVVGNGTASSCNEAALKAAISTSSASVITFNCGLIPTTITLSSHINVTTNNLLIDGGGLVTLAASNSRILIIDQWTNEPTPLVQLQRLTLQGGVYNGHPIVGRRITTDIGGGGAILAQGGTLQIFQTNFVQNQGITTQQDAGGGAIYLLGTVYGGLNTGTAVIESSTFFQNQCSNGGAIGSLGTNLTLSNLIIAGNLASGNGGNPGNGGNGGAVVMDGSTNSASMCGILASGNQANTYGKAFFRVGYGDSVSPPNLHVNLSNSMMYSNYGPFGGFATIYMQDISFSISNSLLAQNSAPLFGALWYNNGINSAIQTRTLNVQGVQMVNNTCQQPNEIVGSLSINWSTGIPISMNVDSCVITDTNGYNGVTFTATDARVKWSRNIVGQVYEGSCSTSQACTSTSSQQIAKGTCCSSNGIMGDPQFGTLQDNGCTYPTVAVGNSTLSAAVNQASCPSSSAKFSSVLMNGATGAVARPVDYYIRFDAGSNIPVPISCFQNGYFCAPAGNLCTSGSNCASGICSNGACAASPIDSPTPSSNAVVSSIPLLFILISLSSLVVIFI